MRNDYAAAIARAIRHAKFLPLCFVIFVGIRLALVVLVPAAPWSDGAWYFNRAATLATEGTYSEGGFPTAFWPIGYPGFLGLLFRLTGPSVLAAQMANMVFAAATFVLVYFVTRHLLDSEMAARVTVLLLTVYPNNAAYVPLLLTETAYTCLLFLALFFLCRSRSYLSLMLAGIVFGLAILVKTQTILLVPVLATLVLWDRWSLQEALRPVSQAAVVMIAALLVVAPWSYRNYETFGQFILVSTNGGLSMLAGNNPSVVGDYGSDFSFDDPLYKAAAFSVKDQVAADARARELVNRWIRENPADFIGLIPKKVFRLWAPDGEAEWGYQAGTPWYERYSTWFRTVRILNQGFYFLALALAAAGAWLLVRRRARPRAFVGIAVAGVFTAISMVFSGQARYHFPVMPFLIGYAAWFITARAHLENHASAAPSA